MKAFFDTNVLVYAADPREAHKREVAQSLLQRHSADHTLMLSTQVMLEVYNALVRKRQQPPEHALAFLRLLARHEVASTDSDLILRAIALSQSQQLSHWDGAIVQAAVDADCDVLYTEDLQTGRRFGRLEVVNPFLPAAHEPLPSYADAGARQARRRRTTAGAAARR